MPSDQVRISRARRRVRWSVALAAGGVVATFALPTYGGSVRASGPAADLTTGGVAGHDHSTHDHTDPTTKNAVSRSTEQGAVDPTKPAEAAASREAVADQRTEPDPTLVPGPAPAQRRTMPEDRYAMAGGCYALRSPATGLWVARDGDGYRAFAATAGAAEPFHFQATDLGRYLLFDGAEEFVAAPASLLGGGGVDSAAEPSPDADWRARRRGTAYLFSLPGSGRSLAVDASGDLVAAADGEPFVLRLTTGCASWPEVQVNVEGRPHAGATAIQEVRGYLDAHTHGMAFEFLGGEVHCGRPWHPYGVEHALRDCEDHYPANGRGAVLENHLRTGSPVGEHDPVGWPTFRDWPAPHSLTHEGTYYKWMERAWRGGQRLFVNLLVENNKLCAVYPLKRNSCDEMDSIRLQAQRMREFERYVDAQAGGPGEGWYRIVTDPFEARRVINAGKMAVVMGIETSVVFGCTMKRDVPQCTQAEIDRQLDEVYDLGVRQMELVNKFDNALAGVAGDAGDTGVAVNSANFAETGSFWAMNTCPESYPEDVHDRTQLTVPDNTGQRDALFGAIAESYLTRGAAPLYPSAPHCNERALTPLGEYTIRGMVGRGMIFDPDHMSVAARKESLDLLESLSYSGVVSSHSWSTPDAYPRIYELGGTITPYAGDSTGFVEKWRRHLGWADDRYYFGFGFGADINGLGAQGDPRGADVPNPVEYPFQGIGGVTVHRQVSGERVYDINVDGVAHYGLYPDWVEDLRRLAGDAIVADMTRGPEAYLQMWERALGVGGDACRDPSVVEPVSAFRDLSRGMTARDVLFAVGQPHSRLADTFGYCAEGASGGAARVEVVFEDGRVEQVRRTG